MTSADALLAVLAAPVLAAAGYLALLSVLSRRSPEPEAPWTPDQPGTPRVRFDVVVPAHDEAHGIAATVASLLAVDYPRELYRVVVVADNCTDDTAACARAAGADVVLGRESPLRGKGYALAHAFERVLAEGRADAVVVVDADTVVSPNLLGAFAARLASGAHVLQADYTVKNPDASWRTRLMTIALAAVHTLRSLARERLSLSCGLRGNGMCFTTEILSVVPHDAFSIVEDLEYGVRLGALGHRVHYVAEAHVYGEMPAGESASRTQRLRWESGRSRMRHLHAARLLAGGLRRRDRVTIDLALDLLVPPLGSLVALTVIGLGASLALSSRAGHLLPSDWLWLGCALGLSVYGLRAWQLSGTGARGLLGLLFVPRYVAWKLLLRLRRSARAPSEWVRTARGDAEEEEQQRSRQKAKGKRQKAKVGERAYRRAFPPLLLFAFCFLPFAFMRKCSQPGASSNDHAAARVAASAGSAGVRMIVRCDAPTHPVSPLIYGIGAPPTSSRPGPWQLGATARRWGGNHTSRYNWELGNAWNTGKDWFFKNVDYDGRPGPAYQRFIDEDLAHGMATALTVPTIGWVAKDTTSFAFPVSIDGPQLAVAPENADIGNGITPQGTLLAPGSPERTSVAMPPSSIGRWVRTIRERDRIRGTRGVQMYILDNEPTLWNETHRDVHPEPVSYDELLERTAAYATEIRRADQDALIAGPALWGFPACLSSGVDRAAQPAHPDRDRHGGVALLPWWLRQIALREQRDGIRLLDVVDVHFYPQGRGIGVGVAGETDPGTAARRIRSTRALWDPTYEDESWIADEIRLIPRIKAWIAEEHPGLGVSIGEYNFGAEEHMSGGLAVAEALGRFGEQGITSAFYWDYPAKGSPASWAFMAYRDFDGHGGRFLDASVPAESEAPLASIFASRDASGEHLVLVLLDLDPARPLAARIDTSSCGRVVEQRRFVYAQGYPGIALASPEPESAGTLPHATLPPFSITVLDLHFAPVR